MFNISGVELAVILIAALLLLGPQRLPEVARGLGKFLREFRRQTDDVRTMVEREFYQMDQEIQKVVEPVADSVHDAVADKPGNAPAESGSPNTLLPSSGIQEVDASLSPPPGHEGAEAHLSPPGGHEAAEAPPSSDPSGVTGELYDAEYHAAEANGLVPSSTEAHPDAVEGGGPRDSTEPALPEHRTSESQNAAEQEPTARAK
jgi:sec-independent protein translocase protein TatB